MKEITGYVAVEFGGGGGRRVLVGVVGRAGAEGGRATRMKSDGQNRNGGTDLLILLVVEKRGDLCPWEENEFSRSTTEACVESFCVRPRLTYFFDDEMEEIGRWA